VHDGLDAEYVLPLRWTDDAGIDELTTYLVGLARWLDVTVVDGSPAEIFAQHHHRWADHVRHIPPQRWPGRNGKVAGVVTGVRAARHERVVIADDDVRWRPRQLQHALELLEQADLVRPQNYFSDRPWHARWDTGRSLLNRAFGADYPGTYVLRRSRFLGMGGYDGDVLFENLELSRTIRAAGGRELLARSIFVPRLPPTVGHFWGQRVRQAYDDLAQPTRLALEAAVLPLTSLVSGRMHRRFGRRGLVATALTAAGLVVGLAELGRRRDGGAEVFPRTSALWAPAWTLERGICIWIALGRRLTGGIPYAGQRLVTAAHSVRRLRRRAAEGDTMTLPAVELAIAHHQT
jgi:hypothetical protein